MSLALLHIGYDHPAIAEHLAPRVARRNPEAALAVLRITGDAEPLRELVRRVLTGEEQLQWRSLEVPGEAVRDLLPLAPAQLTSVDPEIRILAARVVAALDGWAASFPTVRDVLAAGGVAARAAAEMVTEPLLRAKSADPHCQLEAIRALARLGVPVGEMTEALMAAFGHRLGETALAAIRELRAVGTIPALEELAASDRRIPLFHVVGRYVWDDEREVEEIRATIADLS